MDRSQDAGKVNCCFSYCGGRPIFRAFRTLAQERRKYSMSFLMRDFLFVIFTCMKINGNMCKYFNLIDISIFQYITWILYKTLKPLVIAMTTI